MAGLATLQAVDLRDFPRYWEDLFDTGDYGEIAAHYTQDAQLIATGFPTVIGRAAITEFWRRAVEGVASAGIRRTVAVDHVESSGALGYIQGAVTLAGPVGEIIAVVRYLTMWQQEPDGRWRLAVDISSPDPITPTDPPPTD
ncbi:YybH family protein [Nocardia sp. NPDC004260]